MRVKTSLWDWILSNAPDNPGGEPPVGDPPAGDPPAGDPPAGDPPAGDPPSVYRPEGLPDNFFGTSNEETIDKLHTAVKGYRQKDSDRGVPETEAAYATFGDNVPEELKSHVGALAEDTVFQKLSKSALEKGMPVKDFQDLTLEFFGAAQEMGVLEPVIDEAAEKAALVPDSAKHLSEAEQKTAREARMNDNFSFLDTLTAQGEGKDGMPAEVAEHAKAMLGDSAKGHQFIEYMRSQISGEPSPYAGGDKGGSGADPKADLARREALPENQPGNSKFDKASWEKLQADYQKVHGE